MIAKPNTIREAIRVTEKDLIAPNPGLFRNLSRGGNSRERPTQGQAHAEWVVETERRLTVLKRLLAHIEGVA